MGELQLRNRGSWAGTHIDNWSGHSDCASWREGEPFGLRLVLVREEPAAPDSRQGRLFSHVLCDRGVPAIAVESRGQRDMVPSSIQEDIGGLGNVLRGLDTIEGEPEPTPDQIAVERRALNEALSGIHSPATGLIIPEVEAESGVSEGQCIVRLLDVSRIRSIPIHSPVDGFLHRLSRVVGNPDTRDQDMTPALYAQSARKRAPRSLVAKSAICNPK